MILQDKTTGKKVQFDLEEITLPSLKDNANIICRPNEQTFDRVLTVSHLTVSEKIKLQKLFISIVEEQVKDFGEDSIKSLNTVHPNLQLGEVQFTQVFIPALGNLVIE